MDTETKQNNSQNGQASGGNSTGSGNAAPDMMTLLGQTSLPASTCGWLSCLRKSGMSFSYSIDKQHVPDVDQMQSSQNEAQNGNQSSGQSNAQSGKQTNARGGASDTMTCSGSCTIRYFDFALGIMGLAIAGFLTKGCCCLKRKMF